MVLKKISENLCFGGKVQYFSHFSDVCHSEMRFAVYVPPQALEQPVPVLYFLSGLTCTEENFMIKAGAQKSAAEHGLMLVVPDTSPRHTGIAGEDQDWDLGSGAGFYVDAIALPWRSHYQMWSYVVDELPALIDQNFAVQRDRQSIFGHSMGGHGALVCALRHPTRYRSVSAFAPIAAPSQCPWGQKAFSHYLGDDQELWRAYDASALIRQTGRAILPPILIDVGTADPFLPQLMPEVLAQACQEAGQPLILRSQVGYDHSYYFIATFIEDHIRHHAIALHQ